MKTREKKKNGNEKTHSLRRPLSFQFTEKIKSLPQTVPHLMQEVLGTLETDHGNDIVSTALSLIVLSRNGKIGHDIASFMYSVCVLRDAIFPDLSGIPDFHKSKFSMKDL